MTITNTLNKIREQGNGSNTDFDFPFLIFDEADLVVYKIDRDSGDATLQVLNTDYTVDINTTDEGGTVSYTVAPTADEDSFIKRVIEFTQTADLVIDGTFPETQIENQLDRLTMMVIQLKEITDRAITLSVTSELTGIEMPDPQGGYLIGWNVAGDGLTNYPNLTAGFDESLAAAAAASASDAAESAIEAAASAVAAAASAAAAAVSAGSINLPTQGVSDANKFLMSNAAHNGYELKDPAAFPFVLAMNSKIIKQAQGANVASASTITLGDDGNVFKITGTITIQNITIKQAGTIIVLWFAAGLTVSNGAGNVILSNDDFITQSNYVLALFSNGTNWYEIARAPLLNAVSQGVQIFTSNGTFSAPTGVTKVYISMIGGGAGGGSGGASGTALGGGGGGAGGYVLNYPLTVVPGNDYTVTIGAGGVGTINVDGTSGGNTSFDSVVVPGGAGGKDNNDAAGGFGGGGHNAVAMVAGSIAIQGGNGGDGDALGSGGGGSSPFGVGATGRDTGGVGASAAANSGGGGAGGYTLFKGGDGGSGICIVQY